jgi:hypothetical protein
LLLRQLLDQATEVVTGSSHFGHGNERSVDDRAFLSGGELV